MFSNFPNNSQQNNKKLILKEGCTQVEQEHVRAEVGLGAGMGVGKVADPGVAACG